MRILVAEDEQRIRELLVDTLSDAGYDVVEAEDGGAALEKACEEHPDLVLLDVMMPVMDGFEVLRKLRDNPSTEDMAVILLTALDAAQGERDAMELGVQHYINKPLEPGVVEATVRSVLRGIVTTPVRTKNILLDENLGGGLPLGSLTLIEGGSSSGKSVLCQRLAYGALQDGHRVAYVTSQKTSRNLVKQMESIALEDVGRHFRAHQFLISALEEVTPAGDSKNLTHLLHDIDSLPRQYKVIVLDAITNFAANCQDSVITGFFSSCKRLSNAGRTIILVAHSLAFDEQMLIRLGSMCDAHISLHVEKAGQKLLKTAEVHKIDSAERVTGNVFGFDVNPGMGMQIVSIRKVHV